MSSRGETLLGSLRLHSDEYGLSNDKEGPRTVPFDEKKEAVPEENGPDSDCTLTPNQNNPNLLLICETVGLFFLIPDSPK